MTDHVSKNKHLTLQDREFIMSALSSGCSFKHIALRIGKDPTTISKEVKKHFDIRPSSVRFEDTSGNIVPPPVCPQPVREAVAPDLIGGGA